MRLKLEICGRTHTHRPERNCCFTSGLNFGTDTYSMPKPVDSILMAIVKNFCISALVL